MNIKTLKLTLISILSLLMMSSKAQDNKNERSFWFGFQTGMNTSFFNTPITEYGDPDSEFNSFVRISMLFGLKSKLKFSSTTSMITELNVSSRGGSYRAENNSVIYMGSGNNEKAYHMRNFRLTYFELPILFDINLKQLFPKTDSEYSVLPKHHYFSFSAGLAPAINIGSSMRFNSFTEGESISGPLVEINSHYDTEKFDFAESFILNSVLGLAYNIESKDTSIASFYLRWTQSLNNVYNVDSLNDYNMQTKMSTITLGASIMF